MKRLEMALCRLIATITFLTLLLPISSFAGSCVAPYTSVIEELADLHQWSKEKFDTGSTEAGARLSKEFTAKRRTLLKMIAAKLNVTQEESERLLSDELNTALGLVQKNVDQEQEAAELEADRFPNFELDWTYSANYSVYSATFSPDGSLIAVLESVGQVILLDAKTGEKRGAFFADPGLPNFLTFSPDSKRVLTVSDDGMARIWDIGSKKPFQVLIGHTDEVVFGSFSPNGLRVVTASDDRTAMIWDVSSGQLVQTLAGHKSALTAVQYSPDGSRILTASKDGFVRIWNNEALTRLAKKSRAP